MNIQNIRPKQLIERSNILQRKDINGLLRNKKLFVFVNCPACNSNSSKTVFNKLGFKFNSCNKCNTLYVNPRPTLALLYNYYTNAEHIDFWNTHIYSQTENYRRRFIFKSRVKTVIRLCRKYHIRNRLLVDIGAGFGTFCEELTKEKFFVKIMAIEPSKSLAETCRKKGIKTITEVFEKSNTPKADVITCFELVEHLFSPIIFIKKCYKNLKRGGVFILTVPNIEGFDLKILGKKSDNILAPDHLNYFNPHSLKLLLEKTGFQILEIITPGMLDSEIVRKKIVEGSFDSKNEQYLKFLLIDKWASVGSKFQSFLVKSRLSSHMWAVARKI